MNLRLIFFFYLKAGNAINKIEFFLKIIQKPKLKKKKIQRIFFSFYINKKK